MGRVARDSPKAPLRRDGNYTAEWSGVSPDGHANGQWWATMSGISLLKFQAMARALTADDILPLMDYLATQERVGFSG